MFAARHGESNLLPEALTLFEETAGECRDEDGDGYGTAGLDKLLECGDGLRRLVRRLHNQLHR